MCSSLVLSVKFLVSEPSLGWCSAPTQAVLEVCAHHMQSLLQYLCLAKTTATDRGSEWLKGNWLLVRHENTRQRTSFNFRVLSSSDVDNDGVGSAVVDVTTVRD